MLNMQSRDNEYKETKSVKLPKNVESVSFSYDGGRLAVTVNGEQVYYSMLGGSDCRVELDNK